MLGTWLIGLSLGFEIFRCSSDGDAENLWSRTLETISSGLRFFSFFSIGIIGFGERMLQEPLIDGRFCGRDKDIDARVRVYIGGRLMSFLLVELIDLLFDFWNC